MIRQAGNEMTKLKFEPVNHEIEEMPAKEKLISGEQLRKAPNRPDGITHSKVVGRILLDMKATTPEDIEMAIMYQKDPDSASVRLS